MIDYLNISQVKSDLWLKNLNQFSYNNFFMMRQSNTGFDIYTVTADLTDWTSSFYGITSYPYSVVVFHEVYDNIIQGFTDVSVDGSGTIYTDDYAMNYVINMCRNLFVRSSTSISSSLTSTLSFNSPFIDYHRGLAVFQSPITGVDSCAYVSGVQVKENMFVCELKAGEFNRTLNPSAYSSSGFSLTSVTSTYFNTVGIYDNVGDLLLVAKYDKPLRKSSQVDMILKIQFDI